MVLLRNQLDLLVSELGLADEMHLLLTERLDVFSVGLCDHAVADLKALVRQVFALGAWNLHDVCVSMVYSRFKVTLWVVFLVGNGHGIT